MGYGVADLSLKDWAQREYPAKVAAKPAKVAGQKLLSAVCCIRSARGRESGIVAGWGWCVCLSLRARACAPVHACVCVSLCVCATVHVCTCVGVRLSVLCV